RSSPTPDPNSTFFIPEVDGVLVWRVLPNTPAAAGGLRRGDVIIAINDKSVTSGLEIQNIVEESGVGNRLKLKVLRNRETLTITVRTAQLSNQER
ncbi:MAG: PDZ domain-containing protein, partial [Spirulina sp. SIO3F2]|nr:PDZ domain-containing protein [Spirulina sp. SIO3F2]